MTSPTLDRMLDVESEILDARRRLVITRDSGDPGTRKDAYRRWRNGELTRIARGVLVPSDWWVDLFAEQRQRVRAVALSASRDQVVWAHRTAAAIWGLPLLRGEPDRPEAVQPLHPGGRSDVGVRLHRTTMPFEPVVVAGLRVTPFDRTLIDVARARPRIESVPMLDRALRAADPREEGVSRLRAERGSLLAELEHGTAWGRARARRSIEFADGASGSELESGTRVTVDDLGFERPELQVEFHDRLGFAGRVDFTWRRRRIVGEADGRSKYLRSELRGGRTLEQVLLDEKSREDRIRPLCDRFFRFGSRDLRDVHSFARRLADMGVPTRN